MATPERRLRAVKQTADTFDPDIAWLIAEVERLQDAIRSHRSQKADDRCIEDDDRLYDVLGDGIKCDRRVGDKAAMLANCARFIDRRCEGAGWPSYADLEAELARLKAGDWRDATTGHSEPDARVLLRLVYHYPFRDSPAAVVYDAGYWTEFNQGGWVHYANGRVTHWRPITPHPED